MTVDSAERGKLVVEYRHDDRQMVVDLLESASRAVVGYQISRGRATDGAHMARILEHARRDPEPVQDGTLILSLQIFVFYASVTLLAAWMCRRCLIRAKSVFGDAEARVLSDSIENSEDWPSSQASADAREGSSSDGRPSTFDVP